MEVGIRSSIDESLILHSINLYYYMMIYAFIYDDIE